MLGGRHCLLPSLPHPGLRFPSPACRPRARSGDPGPRCKGAGGREARPQQRFISREPGAARKEGVRDPGQGPGRLSRAPSRRRTSGGPAASPRRWGVAERPRPASSWAWALRSPAPTADGLLPVPSRAGAGTPGAPWRAEASPASVVAPPSAASPCAASLSAASPWALRGRGARPPPQRPPRGPLPPSLQPPHSREPPSSPPPAPGAGARGAATGGPRPRASAAAQAG